MELHIQKCQSCGSRSLRNILVRDAEQKVFVQCRDCEELVARYILSPGGYYHAGREFESFLRSIERDGGASSAKDLNALYKDVKTNCDEEFEHVKAQVKGRYQGTVP